LLEALADSRVFKACFDGVNLGLCRVYDMGQEEPAPNTTTGGTLLSGKRTARSSMPGAGSGSEVYLRVDTSAARSNAAAAGAFSPPFPPPGHVVLRGSALSRVPAPMLRALLGPDAIPCCASSVPPPLSCSASLLQALVVPPRLEQVRQLPCFPPLCCVSGLPRVRRDAQVSPGMRDASPYRRC